MRLGSGTSPANGVSKNKSVSAEDMQQRVVSHTATVDTEPQYRRHFVRITPLGESYNTPCRER